MRLLTLTRRLSAILKGLIRPFIPLVLRQRRLQRIYKRRAEKNPEMVFREIYRKGVWGGKSGELYSGPGSNIEAMYAPYVSKIIEFLKSYGQAKPRVVDLGCGDFNVGKNFVNYCSEYIGVDIVPELIQKLKTDKYPENVKFFLLDIVKDELPDADIALLRQVLQHLSNKQINKVLAKIKKYKIVFITENYPNPNAHIVPNRDVMPGGWRLPENSGVYLDKPPFKIPTDTLQLFLDVPSIYADGVIRTYKLER